MLLLSLLLPSLIISLPQTISKLPYLPSGIKSAVRHFRGSSPTIPGQIAPPVEGIPELSPDPSDGNIVIEPLKPTYQPLIYTGKDAWRTFSEDPVGSWEKGDRDHVWFFWFSGVDVTEEGEIAAPLVEEAEWPAVPGDEEGEFELRRRKLEIGMFQGSHNDEVYRETAIGIAKQQQQTEWEQEKEARLSASSASKHTKPTSVDQIIFSSDAPTVTPLSYAHFAFVNCNDEEEKELCYRFLAIEEHRPMLYAIVRNTTIIEPKSVSSTNAEPEVAPLVPGFVHMGEDDSGLKKQSSDDSVINVEIEEKDISEDPIVEEVELPSPPEPTIIYKLLLRKVPLKENLTITDLHNFYEFKRWEKLPVWDDPLNPADGFVGTAMEGKVGEFIGMGYEYWYKMPKWVLGMTLGLLLRWITVTIIDRSQQKRERKKALRAEKKLAESAAAAAARAASPPQTPLKTQAILPNVPKTPEIPVETQAPEEIEVVEHAELAKAEGVASLADVLGKGLASEKTETKPSVEPNGDKPVLEADEGESVVEAPRSEGDSVVETNGGKPIGFTNDDRSAVNPNDDKPAAHTHDDRPVVYANDDTPVVHSNDDKPVVHSDDDNDNDGDNDDNDDDNDDNNDDENDDENDDNNNEEENDEEEEGDDDENQDRPVIYTNGDSPVDHTNGDNLADSMTEGDFDIIDKLKESIMEAKDREPVIESKGGPGTEENDGEPVMEEKEEKSAVDMKEVVGATEDEPVDRSDEDEPIDKSDEDEPVDRSDEDELVDRTNEDELVDRSDEDELTNEDELVDRSDKDELVDRTNEDELVNRSDEDELVDRTPVDVNISPVKAASKTPDTSPAKPVLKTPSPVKPDTSPMKPVFKSPDTSPVKPVVKTPDTSPVKPVLKTPSPVKPVFKSPDASPVKPVLKTPSPVKPVLKSPDTSPLKPGVRSPEVKPTEEQIQSLEDLNSMEGF